MTITTGNGNGNGDSYVRPNFLSDAVRGREIDGIRGLMKFEGPGMISFLAGKPNPDTFPFESITLNLKPPLDPHSKMTNRQLTIEGKDLSDALQYGPTPGLTNFREFLTELQETVHKRPRGGDWSVAVGTGSQDCMVRCFRSVLNPGDPVLLEAPLYAGVLPYLQVINAEMVEVGVDSLGMSAKLLEQVLENWPADKLRPRVMYCNPVGCNPSGCSATRERKLEILKIAKKYGILILEDDPYYYLATERIPSYFELETEVFPEGGHVCRFDSVSKLLSAGIRLGFVTGPADILNSMDVTTAMNSLHPSSISQVVAYKLLKNWGVDGFLSHSDAVAAFYAERREKFEFFARKHLDGLADWVSPVAGMFLWIDLSRSGIEDSFELIREKAMAKGVLAVPGKAFYPNPRISPHVRASFSIVDLEEDADIGFQKLAEAIREKRAELGLEDSAIEKEKAQAGQ